MKFNAWHALFLIFSLPLLDPQRALTAAPGIDLAADSPFAEAMEVWQLGDLRNSAKPSAALRITGAARINVELEAAERDESLKRGGDGKVLILDGRSWLSFEEEVPFSSQEMTWGLRVKPTKAGGLLRTGPFSLLLHESGLLIAMIGLKDDAGAMSREIPLSSLRLNEWQDLIIRYRKPALELIVNGQVLNRVNVTGELHSLFPGPTLIGSWNMHKPAEPGLPKGALAWLYERHLTAAIDYVAIWKKALSDREIARLSGQPKLTEMPEKSGAQRCLDAYRLFHDASRAKDARKCEELGLAMRSFMAKDKRRPIYHLTAPLDGLFDPAGAFYFQGQYHVFSYRNLVSLLAYTPLAHYVSDDLIHWRDEPIAIWADSPLDVQGIWLANLFLDDTQTPAMIYTALGEHGKIGVLARSRDGLVSFTEKKAVMTDFVHHDGHTWKSGTTWNSITTRQYWGNRPGIGDAIHFLTSPDLEKWTDHGEFFTIPRHPAPLDRHQQFGETEFPYLLPFGDKHALIVGTRPVRYWIGNFEEKVPRFVPDQPEAKLLDFLNPFHCFNPSILDHKGINGAERRIILAMNASVSGNVDGIPWYGVHVLPRVLSREGNRLSQEPIPEIQVLRGKHHQHGEVEITPESRALLPDISGDALEIIAEFKAGSAKRFGIKVRASGDGKSSTRIFFEPATGMFGAEGSLKKLSPYPELGKGPAYLAPGQRIRMHLFLDRSLLEVFVNGQTLNGVFDSDPDDLGIDLFSEDGTAQLLSLEAWQMKSAWPD